MVKVMCQSRLMPLQSVHHSCYFSCYIQTFKNIYSAHIIVLIIKIDHSVGKGKKYTLKMNCIFKKWLNVISFVCNVEFI